MKPPLFLAAIAWFSTFAMLWLLYVGVVPSDIRRWGILVGCFLVALFASVATSESKDGDTE